jgi:plasmid stabilization system protein ParE
MTSKYNILLTEGAEQDLEAIYAYIADFDDALKSIKQDRLARQLYRLDHGFRPTPSQHAFYLRA